MENEQDQAVGHLYEARKSIFPRSVKGRFRDLKWGILAFAYGVYFLLPWLRWERDTGRDQAVLFDLVGRKFYLFDLTVYPQDIFWLAGLLMLAAYLLFFVTGIAGRVFCGYFCFQTLWTDVFVLVERLVQGERPARIRLSKQKWDAEKIFKIGTTHLLWMLVAFFTGLSFVLYWGDAPQLIGDFFTLQAPFAAYATALFLTATTYVMAGHAREQVCTYMCPYSRFQSAMFDSDSLIVSYDAKRGEGDKGRARAGRNLKTRETRTEAGVGDCIDCGYCVQVCPTGIDIRNGLQIQCISCALCIDACDTIMDSLEWPRGLVAYTSERQVSEGKRARLLRPKVLGYFAVLMVIVTALVWSVSHQQKFDMTISQVRQPLFVTLSDGRIQNSYEIKMNNKTGANLMLAFSLDGLPGAELDMGKFQAIILAPEQRLRLTARVRSHPDLLVGGSHSFVFRATPIKRDDLQEFMQNAVFTTP
ncbi:cytochrome c oxidase accessory protein CcoG [Solemya elarraichensis gill symbiont]|uniref:Cytochrome c oxidase accessory protein CcoG n=1 Tax=Solemya elarraichensis gill symbiont TaxID=1918949 RepID=A0A1T2L8L6_9GAMM|nr:cytochrome c oxidase accessory protein CcoG [Solemya elarraichensis gill symbiont]OOZ41435.1 cytochrome c oxidase accessory protein CcoG [Solemya elarraichensis gill symbiont]